MKYFFGFVRTQMSTSSTILMVFGPKVFRVWRGQGDQWDQRARIRGMPAAFSMNGGGLMQEDSPDPYQENEELKVNVCTCALKKHFTRSYIFVCLLVCLL